MEFNFHSNEFSKPRYFLGKDYCFLGNGYIQVIIQFLDDSRVGNAIGLNIIGTDQYRRREMWPAYNQFWGSNPNLFAIGSVEKSKLYFANSQQILDGELSYSIDYECGFPILKIKYPVYWELSPDSFQINETKISPVATFFADDKWKSNQKSKSGLFVTEKFWTHSDLPILFREIYVKNTGNEDRTIRIFNRCAPNKLFLPDSEYIDDLDIVVFNYSTYSSSNYLTMGSLQNSVYHYNGEFPSAVEHILKNALNRELDSKNYKNSKTINPFGGSDSVLGYDLGLIKKDEEKSCTAYYIYNYDRENLENISKNLKNTNIKEIQISTKKYWSNKNSIKTDKKNDFIEHLYKSAQAGIEASVSRDKFPGRMNSGIWEYDGEWSRDSDFVAIGALYSGDFDTSKNILNYCLLNLTTDDGYCVAGPGGFEGSGIRNQADMSGIRLHALWEYWKFTDDYSIIQKNWEKIIKIAENPLDENFWSDEANMIIRTRDCWERDEIFGIKPGFELFHQMWLSIGLKHASEMADHIGENKLKVRWEKKAKIIWDAVLKNKKFSLIENGHFIKRKLLDGSVQKYSYPYEEFKKGELEPDSTEVYPIIMKMVDPKGKLAISTLKHVSKLKNQDGLWDFGGYSRYNITSDPAYNGFGHPDKSKIIGVHTAGPWPLSTIWMADAALESEKYEIALDAIKWIYDIGKPTLCWFEHIDHKAKNKQYTTFYNSGIVPWVSYGELTILIIKHLIGFNVDSTGIIISPHIIPGIEQITAKIRYRKWFLNIKIYGWGRIEDVKINNFNLDSFDKDFFRIDDIRSNLDIQIFLKNR
jgi:hypothetical protein